MAARPTKSTSVFRRAHQHDTVTGALKAAALEFLGTTTFFLLGLGGIQASSTLDGSNVERAMYWATCMGLSLIVTAWLFYRVNGGLFNPNVSLALLLVGAIGPIRFVLYCIAQMAGAIAAAGLIMALTPGPFIPNVHRANGINKVQGVFIEMFITTALVLAVLMANKRAKHGAANGYGTANGHGAASGHGAANNYQGANNYEGTNSGNRYEGSNSYEATGFSPVGIGLTLFVGNLFALSYTGAAMNTARAFGPAVVTGFPYRDHWVYWLGPFLGSLLGALIYTLLKRYHYWTTSFGHTGGTQEQFGASSIDAPRGTVGRSVGRAEGPRTSGELVGESHGGVEKRHQNGETVV